MASEIIQENVSNLGTLIGAVVVSICFQVTTAIMSWVKRSSAEHALRKVHESVVAVDNKIEGVKTEQVETKHELNSRLTELLAIAKAAAHAEGRLEGIEEQKRRASSGDTGAPEG